MSPSALSPDVVSLARRQAGLVSTRQLVGCGLARSTIVQRVRQGILRPVLPRVYDTIPDDVANRTWRWAQGRDLGSPSVFDHLRRRCAVLPLLARGPRSVAIGLGALALHEVQGLPTLFDGEVAMPHRGPRESAGGTPVRRIALPAMVHESDGLRFVPPVEALAQGVLALTGRRDARRFAVSIMNDMCQRRLIDDDGLRRAAALTAGRRGSAQSRDWWALCNPRLESPAETWAYLALIDEGCPPDAVQLDVRDESGRFLGRVDLAWYLPGGTLLMAEIDGAGFHDGPAAVYRDRSRQNGLLTRGTMLRFTARDAADGTLAAAVRARLLAAGRTPGARVPGARAI